MSELSLRPLTGYQSFPGPVVAVVMDGMGLGPKEENNGVYMAYTPLLDELLEGALVTKLQAHGKAVGLPSDDDMGNSEVGHNALGAGRIFAQGAQLVNEALETGALFQGDAWREVRRRADAGGTLHLIGLVSDGNVHSNLRHLNTILGQCLSEGMATVRVHALLDGRDVSPKSALQYLGPLEEQLAAMSTEGRDYCVASGGGRMIVTMDRYGADWRIVERGWQIHVHGKGRRFSSACEAIRTYYEEDPDMMDQYMEGFVVERGGDPVGPIRDGDAVLFFNFRGDRAIELSRAFDEEDFSAFERGPRPEVFFAGMMQYDGDAKIPKHYLVEPPLIERTLGEYLCSAGVRSFAISETQKFGHVTYFWNGNKSGYLDKRLEKYVEIESDRITFDLRPWMKASEITDQVIEVIQGGQYKFIRLNYPNGDMVAHTGVPLAVRMAVETVDLMLKRILRALEKAQGIAVITADHGNADCMWTESGGKRTAMVAHTINPVPFIVKDYSGTEQFFLNNVEVPGLANVAATLLNLLGFEAPEDYKTSLLQIK